MKNIVAIGNTPLIRLNKLSDETGCEILGKAEFMNPGGSVKGPSTPPPPIAQLTENFAT